MEEAILKVIKRNRIFSGLLDSLSKWHANASRYRQYGLKYDDLLIETDEDVKRALELLPKEEMYARHYRQKRGFQLSLTHRLLPKEEWTTPEQDVRYLKPWIEQARRERQERESFDYPAKKMPFSL